MRSPARIGIESDASLVTFMAGTAIAASMRYQNATLLELGRVGCGKFSESQGLCEKLRVHEPGDLLSAEIESVTVVPFGCEYEVRRRSVLAGNVLHSTTEIAACSGGKVGDIELERIVFPGKAERCEFLVYGEKKFRSGKEYDGAEALLGVRVFYADGRAAEFCCGDDVWRHRAGSRTPGATARFRLAPLSGGGVELTRSVLVYAPDAAVEKRPWRFKSLLAWRTAAPRAAAVPKELFRTGGCLAAAAEQKRFREFIRKSTAEELHASAAPRICLDAAHMERPGKRELEHGDLGEYFAGWLRANRQLARQGGKLLFHAEENIWGESILLNNLGQAPQALEILEK